MATNQLDFILCCGVGVLIVDLKIERNGLSGILQTILLVIVCRTCRIFYNQFAFVTGM